MYYTYDIRIHIHVHHTCMYTNPYTIINRTATCIQEGARNLFKLTKLLSRQMKRIISVAEKIDLLNSAYKPKMHFLPIKHLLQPFKGHPANSHTSISKCEPEGLRCVFYAIEFGL